MKKMYLSLLLGILPFCGFAQETLITAYVDSPCPGADGRVLEIYVNGTIDLTGWAVQRQANGGGFSSNIDLTPLGTITDDFIYLTNNMATLASEFGISSNVIENTIISSNGDDAFQIIDNNTTLIDRFGEENVDGSGTAWEHTDTYYKRNDASSANAGVFNAANWTFGAIDVLDNEGLCNGGNALNSLVSLETFIPGAPPALPEVAFDDAYISIHENAGTAVLSISISALPTTSASVEVSIMAESSAVSGQNYTYANETLVFSPTGSLTQNINIALNDNNNAEPGTFLALELKNPLNLDLGNEPISLVYILDDESHAPVGNNTLGVQYTTSYAITGTDPGAEILAHDPLTERLFVMNSGAARVEILDFSNPLNITSFASIDLSSYGSGGTSVDVHNGTVVASITAFNEEGNGTVVFMDTNGTVLNTLEVGVLPDMITFSPDGNSVLTANEGQPLTDYSIDPLGSISIIDMSGGVAGLTQTHVTTLDFTAFDPQMSALQNAGVRIFGPGSSVSEDLEPEYISISSDSQTAWVTLQENNAVAKIDLTIPQITDIFPLGLKDHRLSENALDASNETDFVFMSTWPVKGMYMPDAIANYTVNGTTYFVTANEGDAREYNAIEEEVNIEDVTLDPVAFPNQEFLQRDANLGKINMTFATGDTDGDGDYDEIHVFGGRSFSIFNGDTGALVYDSGDDFERITAEDPVYGVIFNSTDDENEFKNRSDNKGPEPEAVIVKEINGAFYAFIGLERIGGFMVYDISNPVSPVFEGYFNNRGTVLGNNPAGDLAPESLVYVAPEDNSEGKGLLVIANEVSATVSVYTLENDLLGTESFEIAEAGFEIYPNPATSGKAFFNKPMDYLLFDLGGRKIASGKGAIYINLEALPSGIYIVKTKLGSKKLIVN